MSEALSSPKMIDFLLSNKNSILVIEDAENILTKRAAGSSQAISNILNMTDGLLSDCMDIQIIATFNTDIVNLDPALTRDGRLIAEYKFGKLSTDRAKKLAKTLNVSIEDGKEYTVAEVYGMKDQVIRSEESAAKIGFTN